MIWTSYYQSKALAARVAAGGLVPIQISAGRPRFGVRPVAHAELLTPTVPDLEAGKLIPAAQRRLMLARWDRAGVEAVLADIAIEDAAPGEFRGEPVLLCFEGPGRDCHRHWLREWLTARGVECREVE